MSKLEARATTSCDRSRSAARARLAFVGALVAATQLTCGGSPPSAPIRALSASFQPEITDATAAPGSVYLGFAGVRTIAGHPSVFFDLMVNAVPAPGISTLSAYVQYDDPRVEFSQAIVGFPTGGPTAAGQGEFFARAGVDAFGLGTRCRGTLPREAPFGDYNCLLFAAWATNEAGLPAYVIGSGRVGYVSFDLKNRGSSDVLIQYEGTHEVPGTRGLTVIHADSELAGRLTVF